MLRESLPSQGRSRSETRSCVGLRSLLLFVGVFIIFLSVESALGAEITGRVIGQNGEGISQAVVFVQALPVGTPLSPDKQSAAMDQINKEFVPGVLPVVIGTEVRFPNRDQIHHHVYSFSRTKNFELPLYKGEDAPPVLFDKTGVVKVGCNIHDWMSGVILVLPTPYYAMTDETGKFSLRDLPSGAYSLACWHELSQVKVEETVQQVQVDKTAAEATFSLALAAPRSRPSIFGGRGY
jgi:plastocyanin